MRILGRAACVLPSGNFQVRLLASSAEGTALLKILMVILVSLWILGLLTGHMMGGFIHAFLVLALVLWLITLVRGEKR